jgi:hypothetical protein
MGRGKTFSSETRVVFFERRLQLNLRRRARLGQPGGGKAGERKD